MPEHPSLPEPRDPSRRSPSDRELPRPPAVLRAELEDLRRYLAETPPHHGAGDRTALQARVAALERALADGTERPGGRRDRRRTTT